MRGQGFGCSGSPPAEPAQGPRTRSIEPGGEPGLRAELGYVIPHSGTGVTLRFSYLDGESKDSVSEPAGGEIVSPFTASRTGFEDADRAEGLFTLDYRALDLEVGRSVKVGRSAEFRLFGGLRYGSLTPVLEARYFGDQFDPANPGRVRTGTATSGGGDSQLVRQRGDVSFHGPYLNLKVSF